MDAQSLNLVGTALARLNTPEGRQAWDVARATDPELMDLDSVLKLATGSEEPPTVAETDQGMIRDVLIALPGLKYAITRLTPEMVDRMMLNSHVQFAMKIKLAPLVARFRDRNTWRFASSDDTLRVKARYALQRFIFNSILELVSAMEYGVCFSEVVWSAYTAKDLGIDPEEGIPDDEIVWCPEPITAIHPSSVIDIKYTKASKKIPRRFNGFKMVRSEGTIVEVDVERAFIYTHGKRFHNLWGVSMLQSVYVEWYFLEQISRASVRYMERIGQPVVLVHYPSNEKVTVNGVTMTAGEYAMQLANGASRYTALAMPSDVVMNGINATGTAKWRIEFMPEALSGAAGTLFTDALNDLRSQISRGIILGDRVATQDGKYGSFALSQTHMEATDQDTETRLLELIMHIERYLLPKFVRYNSPNPQTRLTLETEGLNIGERATLLGLFQQVGQSHPDIGQIDLRAMAEKLGIPIKSDDQLEEEHQLGLERQKDALTMQSSIAEKAAVRAEKRAAAAAPEEDTEEAPPAKPKAKAKTKASETKKLTWGRTLRRWQVDSDGGRYVYEVSPDELGLFLEAARRGNTQPIS